MSTAATLAAGELRFPVDVGGRHFIDHRQDYYRWMRQEAPVHRGRVSVLRVWLLSRHADCWDMLRDPRFIRNRARASGKGPLPLPVPRSIRNLAQSMILEDEPEHRRLRNLVQKAFTTSAIAGLEPGIRAHAHALLDAALPQGRCDLQAVFAQPLPMQVISGMMGLEAGDGVRFREGMRALSEGLSGWLMLRTLLWDLPKLNAFVGELVAAKRDRPGDDILTGLIEAEEAGDRLSHDELITMVFLLVVGGFETTVHLISNMVLTLLQHPEQLARLRAEPELMESAVEEGLRYCGPIHGTKLHYVTEDVTLHGVTIPRGAPVVPVLGAANRDPDVFDDPERFDIERSPNRHLGLGRGIHYCLGAQLARMETRIALEVLLERCPQLALDVDPADLRPTRMPLWHRYPALPVRLA